MKYISNFVFQCKCLFAIIVQFMWNVSYIFQYETKTINFQQRVFTQCTLIHVAVLNIIIQIYFPSQNIQKTNLFFYHFIFCLLHDTNIIFSQIQYFIRQLNFTFKFHVSYLCPFRYFLQYILVLQISHAVNQIPCFIIQRM